METDIGMKEGARDKVAHLLSTVLADTYVLYLKTHGYHWNVTGPRFHTLHAMFEEQYQELWAATDELAERIRALGHMAPGSYQQFRQHASIEEAAGVPSADDMVKDLLKGHETIIKALRDGIPIAEEASDDGTADMLTARMQVHEKTAWMLRATSA